MKLKHLFLLFSALAFVFVSVACDKTTTTTTTTTFVTSSTTDSSVTTTTTTSAESLETLLATLANRVIITDADNMVENFTVPAEIENAVVTWSSSNTDYVTVAETASLSDLGAFVYVVTVNRPDQTTGDVTVTLTGTFQIDETTYQKAFTLRVRYLEDASMVTSIAAGLMLDLGTYITWKDMTVIWVGTDGFFITDGVDIMYVYNAAVASTVTAGSVYDITGGVGLYYNSPEIQNIDTNVVAATLSDAAPRSISPTVATIDEMIANHVGYDATNPMEYTMYQVTGKVYYDSALGNYSTYIIPSESTTLDKAHAIRIYYKSNMTAVNAYAGQVVTLNVILFAYHSTNGDWYSYFTGTSEDIQTASMTDAEKLAISVGQLDSSYQITSSFSLPTPTFGAYTNITISPEIASYLTYTDGSFSVVRPASDTEGTLAVTVVYNAESETVIMNITMLAEPVIVEGNDIFISQYIEGSGYNKYIELYNPLDVTVDLSQYTLEIYTNGAASVSNSMTLSGTLAPGAVVVISRADATIYLAIDIYDTAKTTINFNGDDTMVLKHNGVVIDCIGQIGVDPGDFWGDGTLISTKDMTLIRKPTVHGGDTNPNDEFDPSVQWDAYAKDSPEGLGTHTIE